MYCHVRCAWEREMWYIVLSRAVRVITITQPKVYMTVPIMIALTTCNAH